jgi:LacI family transcriptional regulator
MAKKKKKRVTLADVSEAAGVSMSVVSAILNAKRKNNSRFSPATMQNVIKVVRELNYRPNRTARKFVKNEKSIVGLLFSRLGKVGLRPLSLMAQWSAAYDFELIIERIQPNKVPRFLTQDMVDAIVVFEKLAPELQTEIDSLGIPLVCVNTDGGGKTASYIHFDEKEGMHLLIDYFNKQGKQHPMAILPKKANDTHYSHTARIEALFSYSDEMGMNVPIIIDPEYSGGGYGGDLIVEPVKKGLADNPETDCIILNWDYDAICVYDAVKQAKKRIPGDISVASFRTGAGRIISRLDPPLTHLDINDDDIGRITVQLLNDIFSGRSQGNETVILPYVLNVRKS